VSASVLSHDLLLIHSSLFLQESLLGSARNNGEISVRREAPISLVEAPADGIARWFPFARSGPRHLYSWFA